MKPSMKISALASVFDAEIISAASSSKSSSSVLRPSIIALKSSASIARSVTLSASSSSASKVRSRKASVPIEYERNSFNCSASVSLKPRCLAAFAKYLSRSFLFRSMRIFLSSNRRPISVKRGMVEPPSSDKICCANR